MDSTEVYYFSGTGNTFYLANQMKACIPEITLNPVASLLSAGDKAIPKGKVIGFFFPNHAGHLPIPMKIFINKLRLKGDEYLFAVCNSAFSKSFAPDDINKIIVRSGCKLNAYFNLIMPDNHDFVTKKYKPADKEKFMRCETQAKEKLNYITKVILNKQSYIEEDNRPAPFPLIIQKVFVPFIFNLIQTHPSAVLKGTFYSDSKCIGCKTCEKVCPAERIAVIDGKPVFDHTKTCFGCYGCINYCPKESIQGASKWYNGRSYTKKNGRYLHPWANAREIAKQKHQISETKLE